MRISRAMAGLISFNVWLRPQVGISVNFVVISLYASYRNVKIRQFQRMERKL
jgi:hypothetical protein